MELYEQRGCFVTRHTSDSGTAEALGQIHTQLLCVVPWKQALLLNGNIRECLFKSESNVRSSHDAYSLPLRPDGRGAGCLGLVVKFPTSASNAINHSHECVVSTADPEQTDVSPALEFGLNKQLVGNEGLSQSILCFTMRADLTINKKKKLQRSLTRWRGRA